MSAVFISYRREDSEDAARALYESLVPLFGRDQLFMDVEAIALGSDFREAIERSLSNCGVFLAVIGPDWLNAQAPGDPSGQRRLDKPGDFVRQEVATALKKGGSLPVIPVLVRGAAMPSADQLPSELRELAYRNALTLTHLDWDGSVNRLVKAIRPHVGDPKHSTSSVSSSGAAARTQPSRPEVDHPKSGSKTGLLVGIGIAVVVLAAVLYFVMHGRTGSGASPIGCTIMRNPNLSGIPGPLDVFIDDQQIGQLQSQPNGTTPLKFEVAAGEHQFKFVDQQRHSSCTGTFSVTANQKAFLPRIRAGGTQCVLDPVNR